jgi:hypothetical protein
VNVGNANQEKFNAFFKVASDKNDTFDGKGRQSAAEMTAREEKEVVAHEEREKREVKREKDHVRGEQD